MRDLDTIHKILNSLEHEVQELVESRSRCLAIHAAGDIRAAGNEVEIAAREKLAKRLRKQYYVTHGHVIDEDWHVGPQLDFIVADVSSAPLILMSEDGTEFVPYESVYAIGEIKSTFCIRDLWSFSEKVESMSRKLRREKMPADMIKIGHQAIRSCAPNVPPHLNRNPLFTFFFAVGAENFHLDESVSNDEEAVIHDKLQELYRKRFPFLPTVLTILDQGNVVPASLSLDKPGAEAKIEDWSIILPPEFIDKPDSPDSTEVKRWILFLPKESAAANNMGQLLSIMAMHLEYCVLGTPNMNKYLEKIFDIPVENLISVCPIFQPGLNNPLTTPEANSEEETP